MLFHSVSSRRTSHRTSPSPRLGMSLVLLPRMPAPLPVVPRRLRRPRTKERPRRRLRRRWRRLPPLLLSSSRDYVGIMISCRLLAFRSRCPAQRKRVKAALARPSAGCLPALCSLIARFDMAPSWLPASPISPTQVALPPSPIPSRPASPTGVEALPIELVSVVLEAAVQRGDRKAILSYMLTCKTFLGESPTAPHLPPTS